MISRLMPKKKDVPTNPGAEPRIKGCMELERTKFKTIWCICLSNFKVEECIKSTGSNYISSHIDIVGLNLDLMRLNQLEFSQIKIKSDCYIIARDITKLTLAILKLTFEIELDNICMSNV